MLVQHEAAYPSPARGIIFAPPLTDPRKNHSRWQLQQLWAKARVLYTNSVELHNIVENVVLVCGYVTPHPKTADAEWNALASAAFFRRAKNSSLFDLSGQVNWYSFQLWLERFATIDGDALVAFSRAADGGAAFAFYEAPQVGATDPTGDGWENGVKTGKNGEPLAYAITVPGSDKPHTIPAHSAHLYKQHARPRCPRGVSQLSAALNTAQDLFELDDLNKAALKLAASFGVVETKDLNDRAPGASQLHNRRNAAAETSTAPEPPPLEVNGVQAYSLPPGRRVEILHDTRPSNEQREFRKNLVAGFAYAMGLPPEVAFFLSDLGSAATRLGLQKVNDWQRHRLIARQELANKMWQHIINCEIAAGRLRPCRDKNTAADVEWIPQTNWTIDVGRDGALKINLIREGLADADAWTLATTGKTTVQLAHERAHSLAVIKQLAADYGLALADLIPGVPGATSDPLGSTPPPPTDHSPEPTTNPTTIDNHDN